MKLKSYIIDGRVAIKGKDLYKFINPKHKLRPLDDYRKWELSVPYDSSECWTLDGGDNLREADRYYSIKNSMELVRDYEKKEFLWNMS